MMIENIKTNSAGLIGKKYKRNNGHSNHTYYEVFKITSKVKWSDDYHYVNGVEYTYNSAGRLLFEREHSVWTHLLSSNYTEVTS